MVSPSFFESFVSGRLTPDSAAAPSNASCRPLQAEVRVRAVTQVHIIHGLFICR